MRGLGVTLWELLTRRRLFAEAEDEQQLATMVHDRTCRGCARSTRASIATWRRSWPGRRSAGWPTGSQTAGQLAEYLQLYLDGKPLPIRPPGVGGTARRWMREHGLGRRGSGCRGAILLTVTIAFVSITAAKNQAIAARNDAVTAKNDAVQARNEAVTSRQVATSAAAQAKAAEQQQGFEASGSDFATARRGTAKENGRPWPTWAAGFRYDAKNAGAANALWLAFAYGARDAGKIPFHELAHAGTVRAARFSPDGTCRCRRQRRGFGA